MVGIMATPVNSGTWSSKRAGMKVLYDLSTLTFGLPFKIFG